MLFAPAEQFDQGGPALGRVGKMHGVIFVLALPQPFGQAFFDFQRLPEFHADRFFQQGGDPAGIIDGNHFIDASGGGVDKAEFVPVAVCIRRGYKGTDDCFYGVGHVFLLPGRGCLPGMFGVVGDHLKTSRGNFFAVIT
jgi:hypothetical protein